MSTTKKASGTNQGAVSAPTKKAKSTLDVLAGLVPQGRQSVFIPLDDIRPDPDQPRKEFQPVDGRISDGVMLNLRNFANNIRDIGLKQPITVRPDPQRKGKYMIVWGERRWRAFNLLRDEGCLGVGEIEAFIKEDEFLMPVLRLEQLAENIQREDLSDIEVAAFLKRLLEEYSDLQQQDLCVLLHKPKQWVSRMLGLLDPKYAELVNAGYIKYAAILEQFKALPEHRQEVLANEAKNSGKKITSGDIRRHAEAAKGTGEKKVAAGKQEPGTQEGDLHKAVSRQFNQESPSAAALAVAVARQEVRIKAAQASTLIDALKGRDFQVMFTLTSDDLRGAIKKLGGEVPDSDLLLSTRLYDCLSLKG